MSALAPAIVPAALFKTWAPPLSMQELITLFSAPAPNAVLRDEVLAGLDAFGGAAAADAPASVAEMVLALLDSSIREFEGDDSERALIFSAFSKILSGKDILQRILRGLLLDTAAVEGTICKNSYAHDNGFDKFVLGSWKGWKLRLNVWWPDHRESEILKCR